MTAQGNHVRTSTISPSSKPSCNTSSWTQPKSHACSSRSTQELERARVSTGSFCFFKWPPTGLTLGVLSGTRIRAAQQPIEPSIASLRPMCTNTFSPMVPPYNQATPNTAPNSYQLFYGWSIGSGRPMATTAACSSSAASRAWPFGARWTSIRTA